MQINYHDGQFEKVIKNEQFEKIVKNVEGENVDTPIKDIFIETVIYGLLKQFDNPKREGLIETPRRVRKMLQEIITNENPSQHIKLFKAPEKPQRVEIKNIPFYSLCEHHMLPFFGHVDIAYMPNKWVLGLSKFPRIISCFSHKLQMQEKMTEDIFNFLLKNLEPHGLYIKTRARHLCMEMRGIKSFGAETECQLTHNMKIE